MKNDYEIRGDITAIIINSPKYGHQEALISTNKLDRVNEFPNSWYVHWDPNTKSLYVVGNTPVINGKRNTINMHRWITDAPTGMVVDHRDHNGLNNVDSNLRVITNAQNTQNKSGANSNSKSGVRGVGWDKSIKKWRVRICINNINKFIGHFDNIEDAELAAIKARDKHMPFSNELTNKE